MATDHADFFFFFHIVAEATHTRKHPGCYLGGNITLGAKIFHFLEENSCEETCLPCRGMLDSASILKALLLWLPPSYHTEQSRGDLASWPREPTVTYSRDIYREAVILSFRRKHGSCLP